MKTKITIGFFILIIFGQPVFGQNDSTDISFTATEYIPATRDDSLTHGWENVSQFTVGFEIDNLVNFEKVTLEVICIHPRFNEEAVLCQSYTVSDLEVLEAIEENNVAITVGPFAMVHSYKIVLSIEDDNGHRIVSISKNLPL